MCHLVRCVKSSWISFYVSCVVTSSAGLGIVHVAPLLGVGVIKNTACVVLLPVRTTAIAILLNDMVEGKAILRRKTCKKSKNSG